MTVLTHAIVAMCVSVSVYQHASCHCVCSVFILPLQTISQRHTMHNTTCYPAVDVIGQLFSYSIKMAIIGNTSPGDVTSVCMCSVTMTSSVLKTTRPTSGCSDNILGKYRRSFVEGNDNICFNWIDSIPFP